MSPALSVVTRITHRWHRFGIEHTNMNLLNAADGEYDAPSLDIGFYRCLCAAGGCLDLSG
jgi:hypothetical protein